MNETYFCMQQFPLCQFLLNTPSSTLDEFKWSLALESSCKVFHPILGPVYMGSQVPGPTHVSKSQHGGKVPTFEPQETIKIWCICIKAWILIILCNNILGAYVEIWV
jgi:hypothetical protein